MLVLCIGLAIGGNSVAEAKRFGGGMSFGKKRSAPAKQPAVTQPASPQTKSGMAQRGSARSGMMGMLGGLALGGLLGAMLFGGAFEGFNFFDFAILGLIGLAIFMFLRKKAASQQGYAYAGGQGQQETLSSGQPQHDFSTATAKPDIDEDHFVQAAKDIFMRMQQAWDARDLDDIAQFCTPDIVAKIKADLDAAADKRHQTEVAMLNAELSDSWMENDHDWVAIHFTAMLHEKTVDADAQVTQDESSEVNEIWTFSHDPSNNDPTWYLAGIQQL